MTMGLFTAALLHVSNKQYMLLCHTWWASLSVKLNLLQQIIHDFYVLGIFKFNLGYLDSISMNFKWGQTQKPH